MLGSHTDELNIWSIPAPELITKLFKLTMKTPLKVLIFTSIGLSLLAGFIPILYPLLGLSWAGMERLYLWQLATYLFVENGPISLNFFLVLGFNMYLLWMFGSFIIERSHTRLFLFLYFGAGIIGGAVSLLLPHGFLLGSSNAVYAILIAWMMLNPGAQLLLFFTLPLKAHWLILGVIGITLLLALSTANYAEALSLFVSCSYAYLFALITWRTPGPIPFLRKFEKRIFQFLEKRKHHDSYGHTKIFDIKSGEPVLDDDRFMDAMLDRISRHGQGSLTPEEQKRMNGISARKKRK
jgi:membrane associated rhomboid family serine protease